MLCSHNCYSRHILPIKLSVIVIIIIVVVIIIIKYNDDDDDEVKLEI